MFLGIITLLLVKYSKKATFHLDNHKKTIKKDSIHILTRLFHFFQKKMRFKLAKNHQNRRSDTSYHNKEKILCKRKKSSETSYKKRGL